MKQKIVVIPFDGGYAKLLFKKVDTNWECILNDENMHILTSYLNGEEPREWITPVDLGDFDH